MYALTGHSTFSADRTIPVAIVGANHFYDTFVEILSTSLALDPRLPRCNRGTDTPPPPSPHRTGFIGYWLGPFIAIVLTEHFVFRRPSWSTYEVEDAWNKPQHPNLPRGYAAVFTIVSSIGLIVLCMSQEWWTGPVAKAGTGDIAMIVSFAYSVVMYSITRSLEKRWASRRET